MSDDSLSQFSFAAIPGDDEHPADLSWTDVEVFLSVFAHAKNESRPDLKTTYNDLFTGAGFRPTSVFGQLRRVLAYLGIKPQKRRGPGFEILFEAPAPGAALKPTAIANALFDRFKIMRDVYYQTPRDIAELSRDTKKRVIRAGTTQIFAYRLLPAVVAAYSNFFPEIDLQLTIMPSFELLELCRAGLLDVIFLFVPDENIVPGPIAEPRFANICFRSLGFETSLVVLCQPEICLPIKPGKTYYPDANNGYWEAVYANKSSPDKNRSDRQDPTQNARTNEPLFKDQNTIEYADLREIHLSDIDFESDKAPKLIFVPSWGLPKEIVELADNLEEHKKLNKIIRVTSHDDALALTRAGRGITIAPAAYCARQGVTAFKVFDSAGHPFHRWVGAGYNFTFGIPSEARRLTIFFRRYLEVFKDDIETGVPTFTNSNPRFNILRQEFIENRQAWDDEFPVESH